MDEEYDEYCDDYSDELSNDEDLDHLEECGMTDRGDCRLAGTEFCDWDCPWGKALSLSVDKD